MWRTSLLAVWAVVILTRGAWALEPGDAVPDETADSVKEVVVETTGVVVKDDDLPVATSPVSPEVQEEEEASYASTGVKEDSLQAEVDSLKEALTTAKREVTRLAMEVDGLEAALKASRDDGEEARDAHQSALDACDEEKRGLQETLAKLADEARSKVRQLTHDYKEARRRIESLTDEKQKLEAVCSEKKKKSTSGSSYAALEAGVVSLNFTRFGEDVIVVARRVAAVSTRYLDQTSTSVARRFDVAADKARTETARFSREKVAPFYSQVAAVATDAFETSATKVSAKFREGEAAAKSALRGKNFSKVVDAYDVAVAKATQVWDDVVTEKAPRVIETVAKAREATEKVRKERLAPFVNKAARVTKDAATLGGLVAYDAIVQPVVDAATRAARMQRHAKTTGATAGEEEVITETPVSLDLATLYAAFQTVLVSTRDWVVRTTGLRARGADALVAGGVASATVLAVLTLLVASRALLAFVVAILRKILVVAMSLVTFVLVKTPRFILLNALPASLRLVFKMVVLYPIALLLSPVTVPFALVAFLVRAIKRRLVNNNDKKSSPSPSSSRGGRGDAKPAVVSNTKRSSGGENRPRGAAAAVKREKKPSRT